MLALDVFWLTTMANRFYRHYLGDLMATKPNLAAAAIFYLIYLVGVVVFVINPSTSVARAAGMGALFGAVAYATYDLTNQATLARWATTVTLVDMAWGALLTATVAAVTVALTK